MGEDLNQVMEKRNIEGKRKNIILAIASLVIMAGVVIWYYFFIEGRRYLVTDNAKVAAYLYTVAPPSAGKLARCTVKSGDYVDEDQIIGRIENGPYLRAPVSGQVVKVSAARNQTVSPSTAVAIIADVDNIYIAANIEEKDIIKIREGQSVSVSLDAYPGKKFDGWVSNIDMSTQSAITGNAMSFSTSGTYTKTTQLIPIKISVYDDVSLEGIIGTNATVKIKVK